MRRKSWIQWVVRGTAILALFLAGSIALAHEALHQGNDAGCPVCLQGHIQGPALEWNCLYLAGPPRPTWMDVGSSLPLYTQLHARPRPGRAPPTPLA